MKSLKTIWRRLHSLGQRRTVKREIDEELRFHIDQRVSENIATGMTAEKAEREARKRFGNLQSVREKCRDARGANFCEAILQDVRFGLRMLRRNPGFTAVTALTLALGIGANTAIFNLVNAALIKALPVKNPNELVALDWASQGGWPQDILHGLEGNWHDEKGRGWVSTSFSMPCFEQFRKQNHVFSDVFALAANESALNVGYNGKANRAKGHLVSGDFFSTLGVQPILGRALGPDDDRLGASPVAVISHGYWERWFGSDPGIVGRAITLNGTATTIVGVGPPEFFGVEPGQSVDVWLPLHERSISDARQGSTIFESKTTWWVTVVGRLKPGTTLEEARADLEVIFQQSIGAEVKPSTAKETIPHLAAQPGGKGLGDLRRQSSESLFILMIIVGLVLLIACANVASLLLARAASRQKEIAVRLAVGAGRGRLVRQLLTESLLLAGLGGVLGLILSIWGTHLLLVFLAAGREAIVLNATPDWRVLGFTALISALTAIAFGLTPALRSTRVDLAPAFKEIGGSTPAWKSSSRGPRMGLGQALVAMQLALSLLLLLGAGLFVRTLTNLEKVSAGFNEHNLLLFGIDPTQDGYKGRRLADFYQELAWRVKAVPGVQSASMSLSTLIAGGSDSLTIQLQGYVPKPGEKDDKVRARVNWVGPEFFETLGIPMLLGRAPGEADRDGTPRVAVVNQQFVRQYIGDSSPLGRRLGNNHDDERGGIEIVGVVGDTRFDSLRDEAPATIYFPILQDMEALGAAHFEVRTIGNPLDLANAVRQAAEGMDRNLPLYEVASQIDQISKGLFQERLFAWLTSLFGILAGLLAFVGIYGVVSFAVSRRTREIGIRMALGARKRHVFAMIVGQGMKITIAGLIAGLLLAFGATRALRSLLYGVAPTDPSTFAGVTLMLVGAVFLACWLPARRATKLDPMIALRNE